MIFGQGRTGSSLLRSLLNCHPDIYCDDEILSEPVLAPLRFADRRARMHSQDVYGFKLKGYQLTRAQGLADPGRFMRRLSGNGHTIVHLQRQNVFRHALSNFFAEARGSYHRQSDQAAEPRTMIEINPAELIDVMRRRLQNTDDEKAMLEGIHTIGLVYEDDLLDPGGHQALADRLFASLGLPTARVSTPLARTVEGSLAERITNYADIVAAVATTEFERWLVDDRYGPG